jgi:hypothetical protein
LFEALKQIWSNRRQDRNITLFDRRNPEIKFTTEKPLSDSAQKMIEEMRALAEKQITNFTEEISKARGVEPPFFPPESSPYVRPQPNILKRWQCFFYFYYYDSEDRRDFLEAVRTILEHAEGDVIYYREASAAGNRDDDPDDRDITIEASDILKYEPDMSDFKRYVIVHQ